MRRAVFVPIVLAVALLGADGCGTATTDSAKGFTGVEQQVAESFDDLVAAARKGDARKLCDSYLSSALERRLRQRARTSRRGTDCADQLEDSLRDADSFDVDVQRIEVEGKRATLRVRTATSADDDPLDTLEMVEERGWRLAALPTRR